MDRINTKFIPTMIISRSSSTVKEIKTNKRKSNKTPSKIVSEMADAMTAVATTPKPLSSANLENLLSVGTTATAPKSATDKSKEATGQCKSPNMMKGKQNRHNTTSSFHANNSIQLNNLAFQRQLLQSYNCYTYNGQLFNNSYYGNYTADNMATYYQAVNVLSMMTPMAIMQMPLYQAAAAATATQMTYNVPLRQKDKDDTNDSQKDNQNSAKKQDTYGSNQQHVSNVQQHQHQQHTKSSTKSSKTRHNKRGAASNGGNSGSSGSHASDNKQSSHPWLASNLKGHTDDIHDIDFSNNGKFLASCSEATNNSNSSNGLNHHHHHQHHHHRLMRNDRRKESTSTDSTGSGTDDINNSSSNEDSSMPYIVGNATKNKKSKTGRNRRQRKNQTAKHQTIDMDDDTAASVGNTKANRADRSQTFASSSLSSSSSSSSSLNSSPTASPQQKSSLRKSMKNCTKSGNIKQSNASSINHQHQHHNNHQQQDKSNCELNQFIKISRAVIPPLRQHTKLNLNESELVKFLRYYVVDPNLLRIYGYPVESASYKGSIEIFKCLPKPFTHFKTNGTISSSRSITPRSDIINKSDGLIAPPGYQTWKTNDGLTTDTDDSSLMQNQSSDSGNGSESSSPASVDSDDTSENGEEETTTTFYTADGSYQIFNNYSQSLEKQCVRCKKEFLVDENGEYLTAEECNYHWGKLQQIYTANRTFGYQYTCCNGDQSSIGCSKNRLHVWTGVTVGINGPYDDFKRTTKRSYKAKSKDSKAGESDAAAAGGDVGKVYALDCEMCFTGLGLEVTKITVVSSNGNLMYETFVRPQCEIVDYNTRFSGITEKDITSKCNSVKTLKQVQNDLLEFIDEDTLLIGHALDNDLRALKIIHANIIDTSITFPHANGFPYRRALKTLTKYYLNRDIQNGGDSGHCSFEDSRACLELMLWRVRKDFRLILEQ